MEPDAQRSRLEFEEQFAVSRGQITLKLIALYKALGGGADEEPEVEQEQEGKRKKQNRRNKKAK